MSVEENKALFHRGLETAGQDLEGWLAVLATWIIRSEMKRKNLDSDGSDPSHLLARNMMQKERTARV